MEHTENKVMAGTAGDPTTTSFEEILALPRSERLVVLEETPELLVPAAVTTK
jgi:type IV secretory pathway ATPase VirB11/archaellum biosynthesis ATPase